MTTNWTERLFRERSQDVSQWCNDNGYTDLFYQNGKMMGISFKRCDACADLRSDGSRAIAVLAEGG